jgi:nicotinamide-nucleotide amidase
MHALILTVGDEILLGQTLDTNSAWLGQQLNLLGIRVIRRITCGDQSGEILRGLEEGFAAADLVIMTGGLGPTKDDITKKAIADFFGVDLVFSQETFDRITRIFTRMGRQVTEGHRQQCLMPANAKLLPNRMGTAPGMLFRYKSKTLLSLPGVPYEMTWIMEHAALPLLRELPGLEPIFHETLLTAGRGESELAQELSAFEDALPPHFSLAYLPSLGQVRLRLSAYGGQHDDRQKEMAALRSQIEHILGNHIFGTGEQRLEAVLGDLLLDRHLTLATAESCTGGHIARLITAVPGSSRYYLGSIIAYHNYLKTSQLQVPEALLERVGAVSEEVVLAMLRGVLDRLGADVGIAASGIAGPGGGSEQKPVGTVWIAFGDRQSPRTMRLQLGKDRDKNITLASVFALDHLRRWLIDGGGDHLKGSREPGLSKF